MVPSSDFLRNCLGVEWYHELGVSYKIRRVLSWGNFKKLSYLLYLTQNFVFRSGTHHYLMKSEKLKCQFQQKASSSTTSTFLSKKELGSTGLISFVTWKLKTELQFKFRRSTQQDILIYLVCISNTSDRFCWLDQLELGKVFTCKTILWNFLKTNTLHHS